jgi:hypothetical protein
MLSLFNATPQPSVLGCALGIHHHRACRIHMLPSTPSMLIVQCWSDTIILHLVCLLILRHVDFIICHRISILIFILLLIVDLTPLPLTRLPMQTPAIEPLSTFRLGLCSAPHRNGLHSDIIPESSISSIFSGFRLRANLRTAFAAASGLVSTCKYSAFSVPSSFCACSNHLYLFVRSNPSLRLSHMITLSRRVGFLNCRNVHCARVPG